eukprot:1156043-Pelagomonas_calceolata.AAC.5
MEPIDLNPALEPLCMLQMPQKQKQWACLQHYESEVAAPLPVALLALQCNKAGALNFCYEVLE